MLISIDLVRVSDRVRKDFGNIEELAQDIKTNGLINPPVVTPEYDLVAGERRLRACKHLGYSQIEVRVMSVRDYEHQLRMEISENEHRKEFTFSERIDWARRLEQVERLKAEERMRIGGHPREFVPQGRTRDFVAEQTGFGSGRQYDKAKFVAENADEGTISKLDSGDISITKAYSELKKKLAEVEAENNSLKAQPPKTIEKIVHKTDQAAVNRLNSELQQKERELSAVREKYELTERKLKAQQHDIDSVTKLKRELTDLVSKKDDIERQLESAVSLSGLYVEIEHFLQSKLSPIRYSRALTERIDSPVVVENLQGIIQMVDDWSFEMKSYLPNKNIIDVEVIPYG
jgi:ParB family transcriptional regulator, chromosome partitioning protein